MLALEEHTGLVIRIPRVAQIDEVGRTLLLAEGNPPSWERV